MAEGQPALLQAQDLDIGYPSGRGQAPRIVTRGIQANLYAGQMACLIGPNGAGKSTLIRTLSGVQVPIKGRVLIAGDPIHRLPPHRLARRLGVVLTERVEIGSLSAYALTALGRHPYTDWLGNLQERDHAAIRHSLEAVGALHLAHRNVIELSDGERQKIMIARALAQEPAVILLDEPTAYLDLPHRVEILHTLRTLARTTNKAVLLSIHDLDLALRSADALWLLPPGGPLQVGAPEDLVLAGAFEAAFSGRGVEFDSGTGSFRFGVEHRKEIRLQGEGLPLIWTQRALERVGYVVQNTAAIGVDIDTRQDGFVWRAAYPAELREYHSIEDLLNGLNTYHSA